MNARVTTRPENYERHVWVRLGQAVRRITSGDLFPIEPDCTFWKRAKAAIIPMVGNTAIGQKHQRRLIYVYAYG